MKKRKVFITLIVLLLTCLAFAFGLSSCEINSSNKPKDTTDPTHTHSFTNYISDNNATCEKDCTETAVCDFEGCQATDTRTIPNTKLVPTEGIVYKLLESGDGYEVTGYTGTDTQVYIPAIYKNLPVTVIGEGAFFRRTNLTEVVIPDSVTTIGARAFSECTNLTEVVIGDSITTIGSSAFHQCYKLTGVYITDIGAWCNIAFSNGFANPLYYAKNLYLNNELVTKLKIPDTIIEIKPYAFSKCTNLTEVVISDSVTTIANSAFSRCTSLTKIVIPDSVTTIGEYVFDYCNSLTIYCKMESKPSGWDSNWNYSNRPVVWGYTGE